MKLYGIGGLAPVRAHRCETTEGRVDHTSQQAWSDTDMRQDSHQSASLAMSLPTADEMRSAR